MKILIPTAKTQKGLNPVEKTIDLSENSKIILNNLLNLSIDEMANIYKFSKEKSKIEYEKWKKINENKAKSFMAIDLYDGMMYKNLKFDYSNEDLEYIKENLYITTAFYGIINALDYIQEHRLDFLTKLKVKGKSLNFFWKKEYDNKFSKDELIVSFLSKEFSDVFSNPNHRTLYFYEEKNGKLTTHSTISKKNRGLFVKQMILQKVNNIDELKKISVNGFVYNEELSDGRNIVFVKNI